VFQLEDTLANQIRSQVFGMQATRPTDAPPVMTPIPQPQVQTQEPPPTQIVTPPQASDATGVRTDYSPEPYYSSYAVAPTTPVYGSTYNNYNYYPGYDSGSYAYYYPAYYFVPLLRLFHSIPVSAAIRSA